MVQQSFSCIPVCLTRIGAHLSLWIHQRIYHNPTFFVQQKVFLQINSGKELATVIKAVKQNITIHAEALRRIGMVVNEKKTEIIVFRRKGVFEPIQIELSPGIAITCTETMRALGVTLDHHLDWFHHVQATRTRILKLLNGMKIIRKKMTLKQSLMVVTSQVFSVLYYASPVWLTPSVSSRIIKEVEKIHFKMLRVVVRDYKQRMSRESISKITQRLPPRIWLRFAAATTLMKIWFNNDPEGLRSSAFANTYTRRRREGLLYGFDDSTHKVGKQITRNWCGSVLSEVKVPWTSEVFNKDRLRTVLKSTFYPMDFIVFNH